MKMRDPDRLDNLYKEFCKFHKEYFPDLRFGQLFLNFFTWLTTVKKLDSFYIEDDKMLNYFYEYCSQIKKC